MSPKIPPLLQPYLALPEESSLILLTGVLGAGTNWLVLRYLCSYLLRGTRSRTPGHLDREDEKDEDVGVVLLSFMRDWAFWREGGAKLGLDLESLSRDGRFSFVDGLTGLYCAGGTSSTTTTAAAQGSRGGRVLRSDSLDDVKREIIAAVGDLRGGAAGRGKTILVVDGMDEALARSGWSASAVENTLLSVREHVHASIITMAADAPLLHSQSTTLERAHAALLVSLAHGAEQVLSLRMLDTGVARDVSGVMRMSGRVGGEEGGVREVLYHVGADGGVRVFERGA